MVKFPQPRRRAGPPTVGMPEPSDRPPERPARARTARLERVAAPAVPRAVAVFGPKAGVTTMIRSIIDSAETPCAALSAEDGDFKELIREAERALKDHEVVFLDGAPISAEEVEELVDRHIIDPGAGGNFVRVWAPDVALVERGMTPDEIQWWKRTAEEIESAIFARTPRNYFMIPNQTETGQDELLTAVKQLVVRAGIRK